MIRQEISDLSVLQPKLHGNGPLSCAAATLIPPHRASTQTAVEVRLWATESVLCRWSVMLGDRELESIDVALGSQPGYASTSKVFESGGQYRFRFDFLDSAGLITESFEADYEIVASGVRSTRAIDGCWVSIVHWSEEEARHFNADLKKLTDEDWKDQIRAMNAAGIKSVLIQNVFDSEAYAGNHGLTPETYPGKALYPSRLYPQRLPIGAADPVEAILSAADECGMTVLLGVGLFAWFDFCAASLEWHKLVTRELYEMYGHHASLYGWYISEEMFGSLYDEWEHLPNEAYLDIVRFFREYETFVRGLTPTKPIALAPNNIRFHEFADQWGEILPHLDILIPFAFARDPDNLNIREIQEICDRAGTRFWVDMEMFSFPLDNGLVPKPIDELLAEIRSYDAVEQIFGYQFTGIMNFAASAHNLGGAAAKKVYADYLESRRSQ